MATDDVLPELLKERTDAQSALEDARDEIKVAQAKASDAESALVSVNKKIAEALGLDAAPASKASAGRTNHERVRKVLEEADEPLARKRIAAYLDAEPNSVGAALAYLKKNGQARQDGKKAAAVWASAENADDWGWTDATEDDLRTGKA